MIICTGRDRIGKVYYEKDDIIYVVSCKGHYDA